MSGAYDDIIHLSRPVSKGHRPMTLYDRAAQFSPFAALTGHDAAIRETERLTERETELACDRIKMLDEVLQEIAGRIGEQLRVRVVYFKADERKEGGAYLEHTGIAVRVDPLCRHLFFAEGVEVRFDRIRELEILS